MTKKGILALGLIFERHREDACCLCGSSSDLTGEHKIKASALRALFGKAPMEIRTFEDGSIARSAQGPKSKAFHFAAQVCSLCNSARTQAPDREFDRFHELAGQLLASGGSPDSVFRAERYAVGSEAYFNVFRYFAKLMCCHMAEVGAPRPTPVAQFALGDSTENPIVLAVDEDWTFRLAKAELGVSQFAAHGGLVVYADKTTGTANGFHSTLSLGPLRYVYYVRLEVQAQIEIQVEHPTFAKWCREQASEAIRNPIPLGDKLRLGLISEADAEGLASKEGD